MLCPITCDRRTYSRQKPQPSTVRIRLHCRPMFQIHWRDRFLDLAAFSPPHHRLISPLRDPFTKIEETSECQGGIEQGRHCDGMQVKRRSWLVSSFGKVATGAMSPSLGKTSTWAKSSHVKATAFSSILAHGFLKSFTCDRRHRRLELRHEFITLGKKNLPFQSCGNRFTLSFAKHCAPLSPDGRLH